MPTLHVRAAIAPVDAWNGRLVVPAHPAVIGWWNGSAVPGSRRRTVMLDGHVDDAAVGPVPCSSSPRCDRVTASP